MSDLLIGLVGGVVGVLVIQSLIPDEEEESQDELGQHVPPRYGRPLAPRPVRRPPGIPTYADQRVRPPFVQAMPDPTERLFALMPRTADDLFSAPEYGGVTKPLAPYRDLSPRPAPKRRLTLPPGWRQIPRD